MKLQLKSLSNLSTEIEVSDNDTVDSIRQALIKEGKVDAEYVIRLIASGVVLELDKKISDYKLKDGQMIVYMQTKKRISENPTLNQQTSEQVTETSQQVTGTTQIMRTTEPVEGTLQQNAQTTEAPLPSTFNGINIDIIRQYAIMSVINRVLSNSQLFSQILMQDQNMVSLRSSNPTEFDNIINHSNFLLSINNMISTDEFENPIPFQTVDNSLSTVLGPISQNNNSTTNIVLTQEDKQFIDEVRQIAPNVSEGEIIQYYLACGKDKDVTVNNILNNSVLNLDNNS